MDKKPEMGDFQAKSDKKVRSAPCATWQAPKSNVRFDVFLTLSLDN